LSRASGGKSAILVAIGIALGGKTGFAGRGNKIADLIMHGASSARIFLRIRNRGKDAFRPDVFGRSIGVERTWSRDGGSSYRLRAGGDKKGRVVSQGKASVQLMLAHFGIMIDNPCVLLMQDTAKSFLWKAQPKAKYDFFLKATMLERTLDDYAAASIQLKETTAMLEQKARVIPSMRTRVDELRREREVLSQLESQQHLVEQLRNDLAWAWVAKKRAIVAKAEDTKTAAEARAERALVELTEHQRKQKEYEERIKELSDEAKAATDALSESQAKRDAVEKRLTAARRDAAAKQARAADLGKRATMKVNQLKVLQRSIDEAR
jgi:chromosome segregation ATPase